MLIPWAPEQSWGREHVPAQEPPLDLRCLIPSERDHAVHIQRGPPAAKPKLGQPKGGPPSGLEELGTVTLCAGLRVVGFPPPTCFCRGNPVLYDRNLRAAALQALVFVCPGV